MPPARKRPRAYDPARTRAAVLAQFGHVRAAVRTLTPEQLALPTRLGEWTVRELVAHVGRALTAVDLLLDEPEPARQDGRLLDWPSAIATDAD
ncbi:maleylpyruvate isomerase N-terminal domain-containing protein, partial [Streptomyces ardesiacus]